MSRIQHQLQAFGKLCRRYGPMWTPLATIFCTGLVLYPLAAFFGSTLPPFELADIDPPQGLKGFSTFLPRVAAWGLSVYFSAVLEIFVSIFSLYVFFAALRNYSWLVQWKVLIAGLLLGVILACLLHSYFMRPRLRSTIEVVRVINERIDAPWLVPILSNVNALTFASAWLMTIACGAILAPPKDADDDDQFLVRRMQWTRTLLYLSAVWVVSGTIAMGTLYYVPTVWLDSASSSFLSDIARQVGAMSGAIGSILLLSIYAPVQMVLYTRASELAYAKVKAGEAKSPRDWLESHGLAVNYWAMVPTAVAILGPVLAGGPLQDLLRQFGESR